MIRRISLALMFVAVALLRGAWRLGFDAQTNLRESTYDPGDDEWKAILVDGATFGGGTR